MKLSIITATLNNKVGLIRTIECVRNQTYKNVEHVIVDGGSTDGTVDILRSEQKEINSRPVIPVNEVSQESTLDSGPVYTPFRRGKQAGMTDSGLRRNDTSTNNAKLPATNYSLLTISEPDEGIYDAINKGIKLATGDVIGLLHSDDLYADEKVLEKYAEVFSSDSGPVYTPFRRGKQAGMTEHIDAVYSDLVYVRMKSDSGPVYTPFRRGKQAGMTEQSTTTHPLLPTNYSLLTTNYSVIRYWKTQKEEFTTESQRHRALKNGWMPPHPTLFIRKEVFNKYGLYNIDLKIASDYDMILRLFYKHKITSHYLPLTTYLMTIGGASNKSIKNIIQKSKEDYRAMKMNDINFPVLTLVGKNLRKLPQFLARDLS